MSDRGERPVASTKPQPRSPVRRRRHGSGYVHIEALAAGLESRALVAAVNERRRTCPCTIDRRVSALGRDVSVPHSLEQAIASL